MVESLIVDPPMFMPLMPLMPFAPFAPSIWCMWVCIPGDGVGDGVLAADAASGARNGPATAPAINTARSPLMCVDIVHLPSRGPAGPPAARSFARRPPPPFPGFGGHT